MDPRTEKITPGGRTLLGLMMEVNSLSRSIIARKKRLPATTEGLTMATRLDEIAATVAPFVESGALPTEPDELASLEQALIEARNALKADHAAFLELEQKPASGSAAPQIVEVGMAERTPEANDAGSG